MENRIIKIRLTSRRTGKQSIFEYRRHEIGRVPNDIMGRHELLIEAVEVDDTPLGRVVLLVFPKKGTYQEMEKMWQSVCKKGSNPDSVGIEFFEDD